MESLIAEQMLSSSIPPNIDTYLDFNAFYFFRDATESLRSRTEMYRDRNSGLLDTLYSRIAHKNCTYNNAIKLNSGTILIINAILIINYFL